VKKAALITGASSGIGAATAIEFANNGYFVYLMGRNKERLEEVAMRCRSGASLLSGELTDPKVMEKRLNEVLTSKAHRIEVLVNNAGIFDRHTTEEGSDDLWMKQFEVNMMIPVRLVRAFFPYFKAQGGGSIVNVSSTLGMKPALGTSAYSAVKAAMNSWTQSLAIEGGPSKIRANAVCPGIVVTPIHDFHKFPADEKAKALASMAGMQPLGRIGTPEEIAKAVYYFGSDLSSWTTGAIVAVDGGINLA
jgi:NAD(P)-dependent dehydrogenase (short-subunit alcohol dehydrogenase family)